MSRSYGSLPIVSLLVALALAPAAPAASGPRVDLRMTANDGRGHHSSAHLSCRGSAGTATGYLRGRAAAACAQARRIAAFLASSPPLMRECTQIYGSPDTARIQGTVGSRAVNRAFSRTNGCGIADWARAGLLVPRSP